LILIEKDGLYARFCLSPVGRRDVDLFSEVLQERKIVWLLDVGAELALPLI